MIKPVKLIQIALFAASLSTCSHAQSLATAPAHASEAWYRALADIIASATRNCQTWVDETGTGYLGWRSSGDGFYRLLAAGCGFDAGRMSWSAAYGLGGSVDVERLVVSADLLTNIAAANGFSPDNFKLVTRLRLAGGMNVGGATIYAGASLNSSQWMERLRQTFPRWSPESPANGQTWRHHWPGFFIGIRK
jgi:hypothetical protein